MLLLHQLFRQDHKADASPERRGHMAPGNIPQILERPEADKQHEENINKRLAAGEAVGIVEPVPDKIQGVHGEAGKKDQQQAAVNAFFLCGDLFARQVQQEE